MLIRARKLRPARFAGRPDPFHTYSVTVLPGSHHCRVLIQPFDDGAPPKICVVRCGTAMPPLAKAAALTWAQDLVARERLHVAR